MKKRQKPGLDELMIVNPSPSDGRSFFLGEDGILYEVQGLREEQEPKGLGHFYLGEEGTLYQVQGFERAPEHVSASGNELGEVEGKEFGRFFLGEDGKLYEVVGK